MIIVVITGQIHSHHLGHLAILGDIYLSSLPWHQIMTLLGCQKVMPVSSVCGTKRLTKCRFLMPLDEHVLTHLSEMCC